MDFTNDIEQCLEVLRNGGTILYPTDTVWGIGCDASNAAAVEKIYQIKQRPSSKSMIVLMADKRDILQYVAAPDMELFNYLDTVNKPTTVVYDGIIGMAENVLAADGSVGIRIVQETFCKQLIKRFRKPIVSTSANLSGEPGPSSFAAVSPVILKAVDYVVQYRQDDRIVTEPSSVVRWHNGKPVVIRP